MAVKSGHICKVTLGLTSIAEMNKWDPLTMKNKLIDRSVFGDQWDRFDYGRGDGGTPGFSGWLDMTDTTGQDVLRAAYAAKTNVNNIRLYFDVESMLAQDYLTKGAGFMHLIPGAICLIEELAFGEADANAGLVPVSFKLRVSNGYFAPVLNYYTGINVSFTHNVGANNDTIQKVTGGVTFTNLGFTALQRVLVEGSTSNDGNYYINGVTADQITLQDDTLTTEIAGDSVSLIAFFNGV